LTVTNIKFEVMDYNSGLWSSGLRAYDSEFEVKGLECRAYIGFRV